jgi:uncharacterized membrane protein YeaQ/YmgE (transglycosylase-associated protein family)
MWTPRAILLALRDSGESIVPYESLIAVLVIGLIAGTIARTFVRIGSMGIIGDLFVGVCGALVIAFMLPTLGISLGGGLQEAVILSVAGAVLALWLLRKAKTA